VASVKDNLELKLIRSTSLAKNLELKNLTPAKLEVVNNRSSQLLVIGQAGSGKTSTLIAAITNRIAAGKDPNKILALT